MTQPSEIEREIEFFFDLVSPYSYLAVGQMAGVARRTGLPIRYRPLFLGAVMKASGNRPPGQVAAKGLYLHGDLQLWARRLGVPFRMASRFPLDTLLAQRVLVAADQQLGHEALVTLVGALFTAAWVDDLDMADPAVVASVVEAAGHDGRGLVAAAADPKVKDRLRATTDEAVARGAFGAPTFFVDQRMFWGSDRLPLLEWWLGDSPKEQTTDAVPDGGR